MLKDMKIGIVKQVGRFQVVFTFRQPRSPPPLRRRLRHPKSEFPLAIFRLMTGNLALTWGFLLSPVSSVLLPLLL
jgi:hypothetical protein